MVWWALIASNQNKYTRRRRIFVYKAKNIISVLGSQRSGLQKICCMCSLSIRNSHLCLKLIIENSKVQIFAAFWAQFPIVSVSSHFDVLLMVPNCSDMWMLTSLHQSILTPAICLRFLSSMKLTPHCQVFLCPLTFIHLVVIGHLSSQS